MSKKQFIVSVGEGVEVQLSSDAGILDAAQSYGQHLLSMYPEDEPEHRESLLIVNISELENRDQGTAFEMTEARYAGFDLDIDSQPTSNWGDGTPLPVSVRHQFPTEPMCWGIEPRD